MVVRGIVQHWSGLSNARLPPTSGMHLLPLHKGHLDYGTANRRCGRDTGSRHIVWLYFRFSLSVRDVEALMAARGVLLR